MTGGDEMEPMLTVRDVARMLNIHNNTVRRWSDQGLIKTYRITRRGDRRFRQKDITEFLAELNKNGGDRDNPYDDLNENSFKPAD
jgi:excisionase family DNA binding protein